MDYTLWALVGLALGYIALSIKVFAPNEIWVAYFLGAEFGQGGGPGGWGFYPFGIFWVYRVKTDVLRIIIPTTKEKIVKDDAVALDADQMRPLRINHKDARNAMFWIRENPTELDSDWKLISYTTLTPEQRTAMAEDGMEGAVTTEVIAHVDFSIGWIKESADGMQATYDQQSLRNFFRYVGSPRKAALRIAGTTRSSLVELLSPLTSRNANDAMVKIEGLLKERLEIMVGESERNGRRTEQPLGINIRAVEIEEFELGRHINQGRAKSSAAIELLKDKKKESEGVAYGIRTKGIAEGEADSARGKGRADAIRKVQAVMKESPNEAKLAAVLEATENIAKEANFIIASDNGGLVASVAAMVKGTFSAVDNMSQK